MHYSKFTAEGYLDKINLLTTNSLGDHVIQDAVGGYGYDMVRLNQGKKKYEELYRLYQEVQDKMLDKAHLFQQKKMALDDVRKTYMKFLKLARIAFSDHVEAQEALFLLGVRERTFDKWQAQIATFCNNLLKNKEYIDTISEIGVSRIQLEELKKN